MVCLPFLSVSIKSFNCISGRYFWVTKHPTKSSVEPNFTKAALEGFEIKTLGARLSSNAALLAVVSFLVIGRLLKTVAFSLKGWQFLRCEPHWVTKRLPSWVSTATEEHFEQLT